MLICSLPRRRQGGANDGLALEAEEQVECKRGKEVINQ
jgi:hypothetical protein